MSYFTARVTYAYPNAVGVTSELVTVKASDARSARRQMEAFAQGRGVGTVGAIRHGF